jgi:hypothetical protein
MTTAMRSTSHIQPPGMTGAGLRRTFFWGPFGWRGGMENPQWLSARSGRLEHNFQIICSG